MKLTSQHLAEVISALRSSPGSGGEGAEKRRAARLDVQGNVVIAPLGKDGALGRSFTAMTRDISFVGVGLLQSRPLEKGQHVLVRLPRDGRPPLFMLCIVMHVRTLADGLYVIGVEFEKVAPIQEEQLLGQPGDTDLKRVRELILS